MSTSPSSRHEAFWLDAADIALTRFDEAVGEQDAATQRCCLCQLVSVSCQYPGPSDQRIAATMKEIDERIHAHAGDPELLRAAFRRAPDDPAWQLGNYKSLLGNERGGT